MRWLSQVAVVTALGALFACTKGGHVADTPEGALQNYVNIAFNAKTIEDGKRLVELSTGEARDWIASLSEKDFKAQFIDNHMVLQSMKTMDVRKDSENNVSLVYEITFRDGNGPQPKAPEVEPKEKMTPSEAVYAIKKIAYLTREDNAWKIRATKNVKSFVERKDPLEILSPPEKPAAK